ncbi:MAG: MBL fold metallo-hydrolase [Candidatus Nanopelagicales bacterium]|nr:MBL fold metallo-hydrolase [Candidatus Nanopelagicales bacterium]
MKVTVVGCSGSFPGPDSPGSCYLIEHDECRIVLDLGNGALGRLQRFADIYAIDAVILSHLHVDHFIDVCSYYVALRYRPDAVCRRLNVFGPRGTSDRLAAAYGLEPGSDLSKKLDIRTLRPEFKVGPFTITTTKVEHPVDSYALRVEAGGKSLTYSGDTGPTRALVDAAADTDLALFEASFLTGRVNPVGLHLTGAQAAEHAAQAGARSLLLTHLVPWNTPSDVLAEALSVFPDAQTVWPGLQVEL